MNGKGDKDRTSNREAFRENFDAINWSKRKPSVCVSCGNEIDPTLCYCGEDIRPGLVHDNHYPIPMGCDCFREPEQRNPYVFADWEKPVFDGPQK